MKVILTERVPHLGNVGEIVKVSDGHARNYLIPNRLAVLADGAHKRKLEDEKRRLAKKMEGEKNSAIELKKKIDSTSIELFKKVGGNGKLFGTVTNVELARELLAREIEVERRLIVIDTPIKALGTFEVKAKLFQDVEAVFQVKVIMDPKQAEEEKVRRLAAEKRAKEKKKAKAEDQTKGVEGKEDVQAEASDKADVEAKGDVQETDSKKAAKAKKKGE